MVASLDAAMRSDRLVKAGEPCGSMFWKRALKATVCLPITVDRYPLKDSA